MKINHDVMFKLLKEEQARREGVASQYDDEVAQSSADHDSDHKGEGSSSSSSDQKGS